MADARKAIAHTARPGHFDEEDLDAQIALIDHTHELEAQETRNASLFNCFKGTNLRRLEIVSCPVNMLIPVLRGVVGPVLVWSAHDWLCLLLVGVSLLLYRAEYTAFRTPVSVPVQPSA